MPAPGLATDFKYVKIALTIARLQGRLYIYSIAVTQNGREPATTRFTANLAVNVSEFWFLVLILYVAIMLYVAVTIVRSGLTPTILVQCFFPESGRVRLPGYFKSLLGQPSV